MLWLVVWSGVLLVAAASPFIEYTTATDHDACGLASLNATVSSGALPAARRLALRLRAASPKDCERALRDSYAAAADAALAATSFDALDDGLAGVGVRRVDDASGASFATAAGSASRARRSRPACSKSARAALAGGRDTGGRGADAFPADAFEASARAIEWWDDCCSELATPAERARGACDDGDDGGDDGDDGGDDDDGGAAPCVDDGGGGDACAFAADAATHLRLPALREVRSDDWQITSKFPAFARDQHGPSLRRPALCARCACARAFQPAAARRRRTTRRTAARQTPTRRRRR